MKKQLRYLVCLLLLFTALISCTKDDFRQLSDTQVINKVPVSNAGPDQVIVLPQDNAVLDGTGSIDADGTIIHYDWVKIAGPESFTIVRSSSAQTSVANLIEGVYTFQLTVTDNGGLISKDEVDIAVTSGN